MIFYLSGTGNTHWAAKTLADRLGCGLVDVTKAVGGDCRFDMAGEMCVGFCFPVHGWRPPVLMRRFIQKMLLERMPDSVYVFALCTAGDTVGNAIRMFRDDLHGKGINTDAEFSLRMPNTYVGLPFMDVDSDSVARLKLQQAKLRLEKICSTVAEQRQSHDLEWLGRWRRINTELLGGVFNKQLVSDKRFKVDARKCVGCGRCVAVCPVADISLSEAKTPEWCHNGNCMTCFACYHHCPTHAIAFGGATKGKGQYYFGKKADGQTN